MHLTQAAYHTVGSLGDLGRHFTSRAAVAEKLPIRALRTDLDSTKAFISAVIPFQKIAVDFGHGPETGQFTGPDRALQGAGQTPS